MHRSVKWLKQARRTALGRRPADASTFVVFGCQRSGTSLLLRLVERDWRAHVFGEKSELFLDRPGDRRMIDLSEAAGVVSRQRVRLVAIKPLVESHRVPELLDGFPRASGVWMFRDVREVARSNLKAFGIDNGERDLQPILDRSATDWRAAGASPATLDRAAELARHVTEPIEAAAIFWFVRNSLFFDLDYANEPRLATCSYADLVIQPDAVMRGLYAQAGQPFPGERITREVRDGSLGRGVDVDLAPAIDDACAELFTRLETIHQDKHLRVVASRDS